MRPSCRGASCASTRCPAMAPASFPADGWPRLWNDCWRSPVMPEMLSRQVHVARDHPAFAGHFPGQPLLPGVVLLGEALEVLLREAPEALGPQPRVSAVKFVAPVRPGAGLEVRWSAPGAQRLRFEVWRHAPGDPPQGQLAASGQLEGPAA